MEKRLFDFLTLTIRRMTSSIWSAVVFFLNKKLLIQPTPPPTHPLRSQMIEDDYQVWVEYLDFYSQTIYFPSDVWTEASLSVSVVSDGRRGVDGWVGWSTHCLVTLVL